MKRRPHGVNLDDGTALASDEEFSLLFVDFRPDVRAALQGWLAEDGQEPILFGGQIGTGKTTLLNEVLRTRPDAPPIRMKFDTDSIDSTDGGYVLLMLGQILNACLKHGVSPDGCGLTIADFAPLECPDWPAVAQALTNPPATLAMSDRLRQFAAQVTPNGDHMRRACGELLDRLARKLSRSPLLVADGVDKFAPRTSDYESLKKTLAFLSRYKTLFEVNAVHLFRKDDFCEGIRHIFIGGISKQAIQALFRKRLGAYAPMYQEDFPLLADDAGGNARQALRLLNAYYYHRTQLRNSSTSSYALACHRVSTDILSVPFGSFPADVAQVVKRDGYIEGSVLENRMTEAGASDAVYRNWIFLDAEPGTEAPTRWPARLNPLIDMAIDWTPSTPASADQERVRKWAQEHDISPLGLSVPLNSNGNPDWDEFWEKMVSSSSSDDEALSILKLLEAIGAGLFGIERQDRIIVAYHERGNLEAVRDFLVGKANTYGFFPCREIKLTGGEGKQPIQELLVELGDRDPNMIYSVDITGDWTKAQLSDLDHRRDLFDSLQMLWWIQRDALERYKPHWPQLRQLFRFYTLEEELWREITSEEIESDIEIIQSLSSQPDPEGIQRLQTVLTYLRKRGTKA